jgi:thiamine-phosphate pyrophosphorylase
MITSEADCKERIKKHNPSYVVYRDKQNKNYKDDAKSFVKICREFDKLRCFIHQDVDLAVELKADGVHLTSTQFNKIKYAKSKSLEVIISTHSLDEVKKAQNLGADYVTYSPIFYTPDKGEPKGIEDLKTVVESVDVKVFALGGITTQKELDEVKRANPYGFASIRYFS